jgi:hypothetical protein
MSASSGGSAPCRRPGRPSGAPIGWTFNTAWTRHRWQPAPGSTPRRLTS